MHPTLPCFLTSSDDTTIKLWDWDKGFVCVQQFEGHSHFVMQVGGHGCLDVGRRRGERDKGEGLCVSFARARRAAVWEGVFLG